jgi:Tripartite tricarboxylate transporter family receptor
MRTVLAPVDMTTKRGSAANLDCRHDAPLGEIYVAGIGHAPRLTMATKDIVRAPAAAFSTLASSPCFPRPRGAGRPALHTEFHGLPGVPPVAKDVAGYEVWGWQGFVAPAKTPTEIIGKLRDAYLKAVNDEDIRQKLIGAGIDPLQSTPQEMAAYMRRSANNLAHRLVPGQSNAPCDASALSS